MFGTYRLVTIVLIFQLQSYVIGEVFLCQLKGPRWRQLPKGTATQSYRSQGQKTCIFRNVNIDPNMVVDFEISTPVVERDKPVNSTITTIYDVSQAATIQRVTFENSSIAMDTDELLNRLCVKFWNLIEVVVNGTAHKCQILNSNQDVTTFQEPQSSSNRQSYVSQVNLQLPLSSSTVSSVARTAENSFWKSAKTDASMQHRVKVIHFDVGDQDPVHQQLSVIIWGIGLIIVLIVVFAVTGVAVLVVYRRNQRQSEFLWRSFRYGL